MLDQKDITYNEFRHREPDAAAEAGGHPPARASAGRRSTSSTTSSSSSSTGTGRARSSAAGSTCKTTIDLGLQERARKAISKWLHGPNRPTAALVALDPRERAGARDGRRRELPREPVQPRGAGRAPAGLVLQAVRARDRARAGDLAVHDARVEAGDDLARRPALVRPQLRGLEPRLDRPDDRDDLLRQHGLRAADAASSSRRMSSRPRTSSGSRARCKRYFSIGLGGEAVNPLEMARAYASFANGGKRIDGSIFRNRPRVVLSVNGKSNAPKPQQVISETERGDRHRRSSSRSSSTEPASARSSPTAARSPARPARPRTTATPGSSATRPSSSSPSGSATRTRCVPMLTEFHGDRGRGRHVPRADLEELHGDGAPVPERRPRRASRRRTRPDASHGGSSCATARSSSTTGSAATRSPSVLLRARAGEDGELQAERGRGAERRRRRRTTSRRRGSPRSR